MQGDRIFSGSRFTPSPGSAGEGWGGGVLAIGATGASRQLLVLLSPPPLPLPRKAGGGACILTLLENAIALGWHRVGSTA